MTPEQTVAAQQLAAEIDTFLATLDAGHELLALTGSLGRFDDARYDLQRSAELLRQARPSPPSLTLEGRVHSLVHALAATAEELTARRLVIDTLQAYVVKHAPDEASSAYWGATGGDLAIFGHVRDLKVIEQQLHARGVLAWSDRAAGDERFVYLVDVKPLRDGPHAAIWEFVRREHIGPSCRYCGCPIQRVDPSSYTRVPIEGRGEIALHTRCLPEWEALVAIAATYKSVTAAEDADREAGRKAVEPPPEPVALIEVEPAEPAAEPAEAPADGVEPEATRRRRRAG